MNTIFIEPVVKEAALDWPGSLGFAVLLGSEITLGEPRSERDYHEETLDPIVCAIPLVPYSSPARLERATLPPLPEMEDE